MYRPETIVAFEDAYEALVWIRAANKYTEPKGLVICGSHGIADLEILNAQIAVHCPQCRLLGLDVSREQRINNPTEKITGTGKSGVQEHSHVPPFSSPDQRGSCNPKPTKGVGHFFITIGQLSHDFPIWMRFIVVVMLIACLTFYGYLALSATKFGCGILQDALRKDAQIGVHVGAKTVAHSQSPRSLRKAAATQQKAK